MKSTSVLGSVILAGALVLSGCASKAPKDEIASSADPRTEISRISGDLDRARTANVDVLASDDYTKALKSWEKAKDSEAAGKDNEKTLDHLRRSQASLKEAYKTAGNRQAALPGLFQARQHALGAGAAQQDSLKNDLRSVDEDVAARADRLERLKTNEVADLQNRYMRLERQATLNSQLGAAQAKIEDARKARAHKNSPDTFRKAELSLKNAENVISTNVRNPAEYQKAVADANAKANLLTEVTDVIKQNGKGTTEAAALRIVDQRRRIQALQGDLKQSRASIAGAQSEISARDQELAARDQALAEREKALNSAQARVALQKAIEDSRSKFSPSEAEAYQQGGNLLIRLKSMNFASGRSDLPQNSIPLLGKVAEVAKSLNAKEIKVEGHTDSIGKSDLNKKLSEKRADAVATYLKTAGLEQAEIDAEGRGFEEPIAPNNSKTGRAQNRRVDIIITPAAPTATE